MNTRTLTDHKVNGLNEAIGITVIDEPGPGNANHVYVIDLKAVGSLAETVITFQNGPIKEAGINGISNEALLTVVIDRMRGFQSGPFACRDNEQALLNLEEALMWLQKRTLDRLKRGVEGTNVA